MTDGDSRADRLRRRRGAGRDRADRREAEAGDAASPGDDGGGSASADGTAGEADGAAPDDGGDGSPSDAGSVKDEQVGTYMYLPESQKREIDRCYTVLKAEYEYEFDEPFEKNRHFFPLLVRHGLDDLADADAAAVRAMLERR